MMRTLLLLLIFFASPAMADGNVSATITISVRILDQNSSLQAAAENDVCARLLKEDPATYLESSCSWIVANHEVSQPGENLLLIEPI